VIGELLGLTSASGSSPLVGRHAVFCSGLVQCASLLKKLGTTCCTLREKNRGLRCRKMFDPLNSPVFVLIASLVTFWVAAWVGGWFRKSWPILKDENPDDFKFVIGGMLTLLALIIGFTFSMAISRYDLRETYEEQEANAIATEYVRATQLPADDAEKVQALLKRYLDQRILFYLTPGQDELQQINARTAQMQTEMWSAASTSAAALPAPMATFVLSGLNDVLNSQRYTQAAWRNRIPVGAWLLMTLISIFCNLLIGYGAPARSPLTIVILPISLAVSLFLIADIDSPRSGMIRVHPRNLESLTESLLSR
jgi:hypothetical protein